MSGWREEDEAPSTRNQAATIQAEGRGLDRNRHRRAILGVLLTAIAGWVDAIAYLHVGAYASFMSGNTTRFGLAVAGWNLGLAAPLGFFVLCFVVGAAVGGVLWHVAGNLRIGTILLVDAALLANGWMLDGSGLLLAGNSALAVAMGVQNAMVQPVGPVLFGKTYVSGALSEFGREVGDWLVGRSAARLVLSVPCRGLHWLPAASRERSLTRVRAPGRFSCRWPCWAPWVQGLS